MGISPQLHSLFNLVPFFYPSDDCLQRIFSQSLLLWLQQFPEAAVGDPMPLVEVGSTHPLWLWPFASFTAFSPWFWDREYTLTRPSPFPAAGHCCSISSCIQECLWSVPPNTFTPSFLVYPSWPHACLWGLAATLSGYKGADTTPVQSPKSQGLPQFNTEWQKLFFTENKIDRED